MLIERETPAETARRIAPTIAEQDADAWQVELERPQKEREQFNRDHAEWDRRVLTPWNAGNQERNAEVNDALNAERQVCRSIASQLEEALRQNIAAAQAEYRERVAALEAGTKPDLTESKRMRAAAEAIISEAIPALLKRRAEARKDVKAAEQARDLWLASNPRPTPPHQVVRAALISRE